MLQSLHIHNFALIEDLHLTFGDGVTIFTGETGAGKSILLDAIGMLAGKRASASFVRHGTDSFLVEGAFFFSALPEGLEQLLEANHIEVDVKLTTTLRSEVVAHRTYSLLAGVVDTVHHLLIVSDAVELLEHLVLEFGKNHEGLLCALEHALVGRMSDACGTLCASLQWAAACCGALYELLVALCCDWTVETRCLVELITRTIFCLKPVHVLIAYKLHAYGAASGELDSLPLSTLCRHSTCSCRSCDKDS